MAYLPPPMTTPPLDWSFSPPSRQKTLRTASNQSQKSASGLNIKTDDVQFQNQLQFQGRNPVASATTPIQISNHPPGTHNGDHPNQYSLNDSPNSFHIPSFTNSPVQASPPNSRQPQTASSSHSGSNPGIHHHNLYPGAASAHQSTNSLSRPRRGLLVPAHAYLQKNTKQARAFAERFGKFDYEGEVKVGAGSGGTNGNAGNTTGYAIWVVDKWYVCDERMIFMQAIMTLSDDTL
jgi:hypothetical protein